METRQAQTQFDFNESSRTVSGMAVVFESPSNDLGFIEVIHKGAITEETIINSDVFAKFNHDSNKILARSKYGTGSLLLEVNGDGVSYMFESPNTALGDELLEYLKRGDINSSSFAFTVNKDDPDSERWTKKDGIIYRDIYKIERLFDVSPVFTPAYEATSCSLRFDEVKATSDEIDGKMNLLKEEIESL